MPKLRSGLIATGWVFFAALTPLLAQQGQDCRVPRGRLVFSTPPGAIPEINFPRMIPASEATFLRQEDRVLGYEHNGVVKAYPYRIFWWHEVINDTIGGQAITITYCPLTNTGINFLSTVNGKRYTFVPSGLLYNNNLVMTANEDAGLWPQMCPSDIQISADRTLTQLPLVDTTWDVWRRMHPNTLVVSTDTGYNRDYNVYPYGDYRNNDDLLLFPVEPDDARLPRKRIVFGVTDGSSARAYPYSHFAASKAINDTIGTLPVVVLVAKETLSGAAFRRALDGRVLTFDAISRPELLPLAMQDRETGTLWNFSGEAIEGPLAGRKLEFVSSYNAFWFAWASIWVNTDIAPVEVETPDDRDGDKPVPTTFRLLGSYPNPVRVSSIRQRQITIQFELSAPARVNLTLYNLLGQQIRVLVNGGLAADRHTVRWDGRDAGGRLVSPGIIFTVLTVNGERQVQRLVLLP